MQSNEVLIIRRRLRKDSHPKSPQFEKPPTTSERRRWHGRAATTSSGALRFQVEDEDEDQLPRISIRRRWHGRRRRHREHCAYCAPRLRTDCFT